MRDGLHPSGYVEEEREVLEEDLLSLFDLDGYDVLALAEEAEEQYSQAMAAKGEYTLPVINVGGFGALRPTYFVVEEGGGQEAVEADDYALAVEPVYRSVLLETPDLKAAAERFVDEWEEQVGRLYPGDDDHAGGIALHRRYDAEEEALQADTEENIGLATGVTGGAATLGAAGAYLAREYDPLAGYIAGSSIGGVIGAFIGSLWK